MVIDNNNKVTNSLQVSYIINPEIGKIYQEPFVIKNNTTSNMVVTILPYSQSDTIDTVIFPGWNPELIAGIMSDVTVGPEGIQIGQ